MKITKTKVKATSRKLSHSYTVEQIQSLKLMGTLSDEVYDDFAKIIQEEIDREIILTVKAEGLVKQGWITIPFTVKISIDWFKENMQDEYAMILGKMYFKSHEDAVLYSLTWAGQETEYG
jgi:NADH:ubiquinone oxidoreductase subunit F (NADH-binding)